MIPVQTSEEIIDKDFFSAINRKEQSKNEKPTSKKTKSKVSSENMMLLDFDGPTYQSGEEDYDQDEIDEDFQHHEIYVEKVQV